MVLQTFWPFCACQSSKINLEGLASETYSRTQVNVNRYPSRRAVLELLSSPRYMQVMGTRSPRRG